MADNSVLGQHSVERLEAARRVFDQAAARFIGRPQLRCNLEQVKAAAAAMHDEGLADLERGHGRAPGSFGGRMVVEAELERSGVDGTAAT